MTKLNHQAMERLAERNAELEEICAVIASWVKAKRQTSQGFSFYPLWAEQLENAGFEIKHQLQKTEKP